MLDRGKERENREAENAENFVEAVDHALDYGEEMVDGGSGPVVSETAETLEGRGDIAEAAADSGIFEEIAEGVVSAIGNILD